MGFPHKEFYRTFSIGVQSININSHLQFSLILEASPMIWRAYNQTDGHHHLSFLLYFVDARGPK